MKITLLLPLSIRRNTITSVVPATGPGPEKKKGDIQKRKRRRRILEGQLCEHRQRKAKSNRKNNEKSKSKKENMPAHRHGTADSDSREKTGPMECKDSVDIEPEIVGETIEPRPTAKEASVQAVEEASFFANESLSTLDSLRGELAFPP